MNVNYESYKIFYHVAVNESISKASQKLLISQPAVTWHLKNLEANLGVTLFTRTKRGVKLTDEGSVFFEYIKEHAISYGIGIISPEIIDEVNIYEATKLAMIEAINQVKEKINLEHVLIDAMPLNLDINSTSIIKGDSKSISIAAASVLAKVTRDNMMYELDKKYPMYGYASHKGYPTKKHLEAIKEYGLIDGYRKTYGPVKEILNKEI